MFGILVRVWLLLVLSASTTILGEAATCFDGDSHIGTLSLEVTSHPLPAFVNDTLSTVSIQLTSDSVGLCDEDHLHYEVTLTTSAGQTDNPVLLGTRIGNFLGGSIDFSDLSITKPTTTMLATSYDETPSCTDCFSLSIRLSRYDTFTGLPQRSVLDVTSSTNGFWITSAEEPYNFQVYDGYELVDCRPSQTVTADDPVCDTTSFVGRIVDDHNNPYLRNDIIITVGTSNGVTISTATATCNAYGEVTFGEFYVRTVGSDYPIRILSAAASPYSVRTITWNSGQGLSVTVGAFKGFVEILPPGGFDAEGGTAGGIVGTALADGPILQATDDHGNYLTNIDDDTFTCGVVLQNNPLACAGKITLLPASREVVAVDGVVDFSPIQLKFDVNANSNPEECTRSFGYRLRYTCFSSSVSTFFSSSTFSVNRYGHPVSLEVTQDVADFTLYGMPIDPPIIVQARDIDGNLITGGGYSVTVTGVPFTEDSTTVVVLREDGNGGLETTFDNLIINTLSSSNTLSFELNDAYNTPERRIVYNHPDTFISYGPPATLVFTVQPTGTTGGKVLGTQPKLVLKDADGNSLLGSTALDGLTVTVSLVVVSGDNTPTQSVSSFPIVDGTVNFAGYSVDRTGTYRINCQVSSGPFSSVSGLSDPFTITTGVLAISGYTDSVDSTGGIALNPAPETFFKDLGGNPVHEGSTVTATLLALSESGPQATLSNGVATIGTDGRAVFTGITVDFVGEYQLRYQLNDCPASVQSTNPQLCTFMSNSFLITLGPVQRIRVTTQPGNSTGGDLLSVQPAIVLADNGLNPDYSSSTDGFEVTVSLLPEAGSSATLVNSETVTLTNGAASFSNLAVDLRGGHQLRFTYEEDETVQGTSETFHVSVGPPLSFVIATQPVTTYAGENIISTIRLLDRGKFG